MEPGGGRRSPPGSLPTWRNAQKWPTVETRLPSRNLTPNSTRRNPMVDVVVSDRAADWLRDAVPDIRDRITNTLHDITDVPDHYLKRLSGSPYYRLRVGDYRVIIAWRKDDGGTVRSGGRSPSKRLRFDRQTECPSCAAGFEPDGETHLVRLACYKSFGVSNPTLASARVGSPWALQDLNRRQTGRDARSAALPGCVCQASNPSRTHVTAHCLSQDEWALQDLNRSQRVLLGLRPARAASGRAQILRVLLLAPRVRSSHRSGRCRI